MDVPVFLGMLLTGWVVSYTLRVFKKLLLVFLGVQMIILLSFERWGLITINYGNIAHFIQRLMEFDIGVIFSTLPYVAPFLVGFVVGIFFPKSIQIKRRKYLRVGE